MRGCRERPRAAVLEGTVDLLRAGGDVEHVDGAVEEGEGGDGLVVGDLVAGLVDAREAEVAVLARLAVLDAVDRHGGVVCCAESVSRGREGSVFLGLGRRDGGKLRLGNEGGYVLGGVGVVGGERDGLPSEPVADVVCVAVDEGDADGGVQDHLEVFDEVREDEVAGLLEGVVDLVIGVLCVVQVYADRVLGRGQIEEVLEV